MHTPNQYDLLRERRFLPFFLTQFLGAFNDNVFKNALMILLAFKAAEWVKMDANLVQNIGQVVFILPFLLFSATSGQIADKYEKSKLIRLVKLFEIAIMLVAAYGFLAHQPILLFVALFMMGMHSTLFGPVKYSILPQQLKREELVGGNGLVESGTFLAILLGEILGGVLVGVETNGTLLIAVTTLVLAALGYLTSRAIPLSPAADPGIKVNWEPISETWRNLKLAKRNRTVFLSILGISWFWFYGAVFLTQFPNFSKHVLGGNEHVVTLLLAVFSIGVGLGSLLCERLSGHKVEIGLVPFGSIGLSLFGIDLYFASHALAPVSGEGIGVLALLRDFSHWRVLFDLLMVGLFGGFYIVPLYALVQTRSEKSHVSRMIATNNILNALFIVLAAGLAILVLNVLKLGIPQLFLIGALLNAAVAIYIYKLVPEFLMRFVVWLLVHSVYRLDKQGLERIPETGAALLVCNHVSLVDALVIAAGCPRPIRFVMDHNIFKTPILSFVFRTARAIPIASAKEDPKLLELAYDEIAKALEQGDLVGIFPEGQITYSGEMNAFKPGAQRIVSRTPVPVVPLALRGLWGSFFSRQGGKAMTRLFPRGVLSKIGLVAGDPIPPERVTAEELHGVVLDLRGDWK
jgi:1-acyl-sn-glycerol-3-phosphate acyltransferase